MSFRPFQPFRGFGGGAAYSPLSLTPALWLSDSGSDPSVWSDLSGNGRHVSEASAGVHPAIVTNVLNGRQVRRFSATNQVLRTASNSPFSGSAFAITVIAAVVRRTANLNYSALLGQTDNVTTGGMAFGSFNSQSGALCSDHWNPRGTRTSASNVLAADSPQVISWVCPSWGSQSSNVEIFLSGVQMATANYGGVSGSTLIAGTIRIGNWDHSRSDMQWPGDIAEVIVCAAALSTTDRQNVERWLGAKYGISVA